MTIIFWYNNSKKLSILFLKPGVLLKFFSSALLNSQHSGCMASTEHCCRMAPGTKWEIFSYWHPPLELTLPWWAWGTGKAVQKKSHGLAIASAEIIPSFVQEILHLLGTSDAWLMSHSSLRPSVLYWRLSDFCVVYYTISVDKVSESFFLNYHKHHLLSVYILEATTSRSCLVFTLQLNCPSYRLPRFFYDHWAQCTRKFI